MKRVREITVDAEKLLSDDGWETLIGVALRECTAGDAEAVRHAASQNPAIADRLRHAERTVSALASARMRTSATPVPAALRTRLVALMRPASLLDRAAEQVREVLAALVFDTRTDGATLAGFRGSSNERHAMYAADDTEIKLRMSPLPSGRVAIMGEIHGETPVVRVYFSALDASRDPIEAVLTQGALFEIEVPAGTYETTVAFAEHVVVIPAMDLTPE